MVWTTEHYVTIEPFDKQITDVQGMSVRAWWRNLNGSTGAIKNYHVTTHRLMVF